MRIPEHIVEQVRSNADIVEVVGVHVPLVKKGRSYLGLCPFHKEKTPSFNVSREKGFYKCFGCGRSGDSIKFLQEHLHLDFVEAVTRLAEQLHIAIPVEETDDPTGEHAQRDAVLKVLRRAEEYYQDILLSSDGAPARTFFEQRGFSTDTVEKFALGAAPASWDSLLTALTTGGFTTEHLEAAGLIITRDDGGQYDRFRGRAMFPIHDAQGRTVGFSARQLTNDTSAPKYINSPQTIVFDKSRVLYGIDVARRAISDQRLAYFVEGQADVLAMHQAGFTNTVATSGTALTVEHLQAIKRYADTVVLVFDADAAGQKAMSRAIEHGLIAGLSIQCVVLPVGSDPDSLIREHGAQGMQASLDAATPWMTFQVDQYKSLSNFSDPATQSAAIRTLMSWIRTVPDAIQHPFLVRDLARHFDISEELLQKQFTSTPQKRQPIAPSAPTQPSRQQIPRPPRPSPLPRVHPAERELLRVALSVEHGITDLIHVFQVRADQFITATAKNLYSVIAIATEEQPDVAAYLLGEANLDSEAHALVKDLLESTVHPSSKWQRFEVEIPPLETHRLIANALDQLERFRLEAEIAGLRKLIPETPEFAEQKKIMHKIEGLQQERIALNKRIEQSSRDVTWHDADSASAY